MSDTKKDRNRAARTVSSSVGIGLLAVLMAGVVAFGANSIRPLTAGGDAEATPTEKAEPAEPSAKPDAQAPKDDETAFAGGDEGSFREEHPDATPAEQPKDEPAAEPTPKPKPDAEPTPKPEATEKPKPVSDHLELDAWTKEGRIKLAWSKYAGDAFSYYKVLRSRDATITWPPGENDKLVVAIEDRSVTYAIDKPDCGVEWHYRVFAVRATEAGYKVVAASNVAGAYIECPKPAEPQVMGFEAWQTEAGHVKLAWQQCTRDGFAAYKVVRSQTNELPAFPLHEGDELLAAIGNREQTVYEDGAVEPGQTWFYRVLCVGGDGAVLGATKSVAVSIE